MVCYRHYVYPKGQATSSASDRDFMPEACSHLQTVVKDGIHAIVEQGLTRLYSLPMVMIHVMCVTQALAAVIPDCPLP
jgi:hypothetical protein